MPKSHQTDERPFQRPQNSDASTLPSKSATSDVFDDDVPTQRSMREVALSPQTQRRLDNTLSLPDTGADGTQMSRQDTCYLQETPLQPKTQKRLDSTLRMLHERDRAPIVANAINSSSTIQRMRVNSGFVLMVIFGVLTSTIVVVATLTEHTDLANRATDMLFMLVGAVVATVTRTLAAPTDGGRNA